MAQDIRKLRKDLTLKLGHECDVYSHLRKEMGTRVWEQWRIVV
jgi:hypothetical protein